MFSSDSFSFMVTELQAAQNELRILNELAGEDKRRGKSRSVLKQTHCGGQPHKTASTTCNKQKCTVI